MLIISIFYLLFTNALTKVKEKSIFYSRNGILILLSSLYIAYNNLNILSSYNGISLYGGTFNITSITQSFDIFILLISSIILIYNSFYHRILISNISSKITDILWNKNKFIFIQIGDTNIGQYRIIEYPLIILFIICGAIFLMSSGDLISVFISIELQSYGLYILSTLNRDSEQSTWGGLTYFLLGGMSSCFILLGSALMYVNSGTTSLDGIYIISSITDITSYLNCSIDYILYDTVADNFLNSIHIWDHSYIDLSFIILSVGFLFKVSAAPFHFWSPDVYDAIPTTVTTYVAIIAKISIFIFLLELVYYANAEASYYSWKDCFLVSSLLSLVIGSILGLTQYRIKRLYAYSTISHVGFILLALSVNNTESIQAYIFYILSYTISNLNAFIILVTIGYSLYLYTYNTEYSSPFDKYDLNSNTKKNNNLNSEYKQYMEINNKVNTHKNNLYVYDNIKTENDIFLSKVNLKDNINSPIQLINQLKGYFYINPYICLSLTITLFSFIGIPPLLGFFAKQMVLSAALDNGYIFITLVGIITSVIAAAYYLNIIKQMFFFKSDYTINPVLNKLNLFITEENKKNDIFNLNNIKISSILSITISILTLLLSLFIFIPNESFNLTKILTLLLFN